MGWARSLGAATILALITSGCGSSAPQPTAPGEEPSPPPPADAAAAADTEAPATPVPAGAPEAPGRTDPNAEFSCEQVGGQCMEGCEEGWVPYPKLHRPCTDAACCVKNLPLCAEDLGGTCMEGCEGTAKPLAQGTYRGCTDSVCCK